MRKPFTTLILAAALATTLTSTAPRPAQAFLDGGGDLLAILEVLQQMVARLEKTLRPALHRHQKDVEGTLHELRVLGYDLEQLRRQFDVLFPTAPPTAPAELIALRHRQEAAVREVTRHAMTAQAVLLAQQGELAKLGQVALLASEESDGPTQAIQANGQLLGILLQHQTQVQNALFTLTKLVAADAALRNAEAERQRALAEAAYRGRLTLIRGPRADPFRTR